MGLEGFQGLDGYLQNHSGYLLQSPEEEQHLFGGSTKGSWFVEVALVTRIRATVVVQKRTEDSQCCLGWPLEFFAKVSLGRNSSVLKNGWP